MPTPTATLLRRLLAVALLACTLAWSAPSPATAAPACSCATGSGSGSATDGAAVSASDTERLARNANDVFTGTVTSVTSTPREDGARGAVFTHEVDVDLVYKGDIRDEVVEVQTVSGTECALGELPTGTPYVFFVEVSDGVLVAADCGGTQRKRGQLVTELEALYGEGEPPQPEQPAETATITPVADVGDPPTFTRAAAPGAALVLVGLLGLVVVRRLARRS